MKLMRTSVWSDRRGSAATEMALVTPLLVALMFGSLELGKYFWDEHLLVKAVRDGARFASRQNFASMPCGGAATNESQIKNVVRFGKPVVGGADKPLLYYWTNSATITIAIDCYANSGVGGARVYNGLYASRPQVPVVKVTASVPYTPLVGSIGFQSTGLSLNASSQGTVFGL
ncbi:MAG: TadE family protein [Sphingomicrobium sp.]